MKASMRLSSGMGWWRWIQYRACPCPALPTTKASCRGVLPLVTTAFPLSKPFFGTLWCFSGQVTPSLRFLKLLIHHNTKSKPRDPPVEDHEMSLNYLHSYWTNIKCFLIDITLGFSEGKKCLLRIVARLQAFALPCNVGYELLTDKILFCLVNSACYQHQWETSEAGSPLFLMEPNLSCLQLGLISLVASFDKSYSVIFSAHIFQTAFIMNIRNRICPMLFGNSSRNCAPPRLIEIVAIYYTTLCAKHGAFAFRHNFISARLYTDLCFDMLVTALLKCLEAERGLMYLD